jgi:hypothetical protein
MKELLELFVGISNELPAIKALAKNVGEELYPILESFSDGMVDVTARSVKRYQDVHGFTREEAISMVLSQKQQLVDNLNKQNNR